MIDTAHRRLNGNWINGLREKPYAEPVARGESIQEWANHHLKEGVEQLRAAILDSNDDITEHVKWNAPSFRYAGEDRATFRLFPEDRV